MGRTRHLQEHCFLIGSWPWCCWRSPVGPRAGGIANIASPGCREEPAGGRARQESAGVQGVAGKDAGEDELIIPASTCEIACATAQAGVPGVAGEDAWKDEVIIPASTCEIACATAQAGVPGVAGGDAEVITAAAPCTAAKAT